MPCYTIYFGSLFYNLIKFFVMPQTETDLSKTKINLQETKSCPETVGTHQCLSCVSRGTCPSGFTDAEDVRRAESLTCCKGQS